MSKCETHRFKFESATPERLARVLLRPISDRPQPNFPLEWNLEQQVLPSKSSHEKTLPEMEAEDRDLHSWD